MNRFVLSKCGLILFASGLAASSAIGQYTIRPLIKQGDPLPGYPGWTFINANGPFINNKGDLITSIGVGESTGNSFNGIFTRSADGTFRKIITPRDPVPTWMPAGLTGPSYSVSNFDELGNSMLSVVGRTPTGATANSLGLFDLHGNSVKLPDFLLYPVMSNGRVAFGDQPYGIRTGSLFGVWTFIVKSGDILPGFPPGFGNVIGPYGSPAKIDRNGFAYAYLQSDYFETGMYRFSPSGAATSLVRANGSTSDPVPTYYSSVSNLTVSSSGRTAWLGTYRRPSDGTSHIDVVRDGVVVATWPEFLSGFPQGPGTNQGPTIERIGDDGTVILYNSWVSTNSFIERFAITPAGSLVKVFATGDTIPGKPGHVASVFDVSGPNASGVCLVSLYESPISHIFSWSASAGFTRILATNDPIEWSPGDVRTVQSIGNYFPPGGAGYPPALADDGAWTFQLQVSAGATSDRYGLFRALPSSVLIPTVTLQPTPQSACPGGSAVFTSVASAGSSSPLTKWQAQISGTWTDLAEGPLTITGSVIATVSGSQTPTLTITAANTAPATTLPIRAKWFNAAGITLSSAATLTIHDASEAVCCPCAADFDNSGGTPDASDIDAFFSQWLLGDASADADCSGGTPDAGDIDVFFSEWLAGGC